MYYRIWAICTLAHLHLGTQENVTVIMQWCILLSGLLNKDHLLYYSFDRRSDILPDFRGSKFRNSNQIIHDTIEFIVAKYATLCKLVYTLRLAHVSAMCTRIPKRVTLNNMEWPMGAVSLSQT